MKPTIKALALATTLTTTLIAPKAEAADYYGLACIHNPTNTTINYSYAWGNDGWRTVSVLPGHLRSHAFEYYRPNDHLSPSLWIRFDSDLSSGVDLIRYELSTIYGSPSTDCNRYGKDYVFVYDGGELDLVGW